MRIHFGEIVVMAADDVLAQLRGPGYCHDKAHHLASSGMAVEVLEYGAADLRSPRTGWECRAWLREGARRARCLVRIRTEGAEVEGAITLDERAGKSTMRADYVVTFRDDRSELSALYQWLEYDARAVRGMATLSAA